MPESIETRSPAREEYLQKHLNKIVDDDPIESDLPSGILPLEMLDSDDGLLPAELLDRNCEKEIAAYLSAYPELAQFWLRRRKKDSGK